MRKLIIGALSVLICAGILSATDSSKRIAELSSQGYTAGYLVDNGLTAIFAADGTGGIATTNRYQIQREVMTVPVTLASAGEDTVWTQLFTVPTGQTFYVEEILLSSHTEVSGNNDSSWGAILYYGYNNGGDTALVLDTCVSQLNVDADSAAYDDTTLSLTLVDSVFSAGEIATWWQMNYADAATGGEGAAVTIKFRRDE